MLMMCGESDGVGKWGERKWVREEGKRTRRRAVKREGEKEREGRGREWEEGGGRRGGKRRKKRGGGWVREGKNFVACSVEVPDRPSEILSSLGGALRPPLRHCSLTCNSIRPARGAVIPISFKQTFDWKQHAPHTHPIGILLSHQAFHQRVQSGS